MPISYTQRPSKPNNEFFIYVLYGQAYKVSYKIFDDIPIENWEQVSPADVCYPERVWHKENIVLTKKNLWGGC